MSVWESVRTGLFEVDRAVAVAREGDSLALAAGSLGEGLEVSFRVGEGSDLLIS